MILCRELQEYIIALKEHSLDGFGLNDLLHVAESNAEVSKFIHDYIDLEAGSEDLSGRLKPIDAFGCRRPLVSEAYYQVFNQENVTLVDSASGGGIAQFKASGDPTCQLLGEG